MRAVITTILATAAVLAMGVGVTAQQDPAVEGVLEVLQEEVQVETREEVAAEPEPEPDVQEPDPESAPETDAQQVEAEPAAEPVVEEVEVEPARDPPTLAELIGALTGAIDNAAATGDVVSARAGDLQAARETLAAAEAAHAEAVSGQGEADAGIQSAAGALRDFLDTAFLVPAPQ